MVITAPLSMLPLMSLPSVLSSLHASSVGVPQVRVAWHKATGDQLSAYCKHVADTPPPRPGEALSSTNPECTLHLSELEHGQAIETP